MDAIAQAGRRLIWFCLGGLTVTLVMVAADPDYMIAFRAGLEVASWRTP